MYLVNQPRRQTDIVFLNLSCFHAPTKSLVCSVPDPWMSFYIRSLNLHFQKRRGILGAKR